MQNERGRSVIRGTFFLKRAFSLQGEVLAPELPSKRNRFSFASPSPSSGSLVLNAMPVMEYHSDALAAQNPYGVSPRLLLTALTTSNANDGEYFLWIYRFIKSMFRFFSHCGGYNFYRFCDILRTHCR